MRERPFSPAGSPAFTTLSLSLENILTDKIYLADALALRCIAVVVSIRSLDGGRLAVRTDRTIFHPQGGGQKADRGRIGRAHVQHVAHDGPEVDHFVDCADGMEIGQALTMEVEPEWRAFNAAFHTAGHLVAGLVERHWPGVRAVSGHQWPGEARVEFEPALPRESFDLPTLNTLIGAAIAQGWPLRVHAIGGERCVQIGDLAPIPCGGTHLGSLSELEHVRVDAIKVKGGRVRMSYTAAPRAT